jgi:predicted CopG family antitoxin
MANLQELKENYDNNEMKTIVVSQKNYNKLKELGHFGDSYNTIIGRLLEAKESLKW